MNEQRERFVEKFTGNKPKVWRPTAHDNDVPRKFLPMNSPSPVVVDVVVVCRRDDLKFNARCHVWVQRYMLRALRPEPVMTTYDDVVGLLLRCSLSPSDCPRHLLSSQGHLPRHLLPE